MADTGVSPFSAWESFYVIVGSSSAALTGLMFVVISLLPEGRARLRASEETISAFSTPTVIHLCGGLLISAILTAPWHVLWKPGLALAAAGLTGIIYSGLVLRRVRRQADYKPVAEDWIWHAILPLIAYVILLTAGITLRGNPTGALFAIGAATVLLLFIGIHNAWDTVTFVALRRMQLHDELPGEPLPPAAGDGITTRRD
jgi:hypothetical protein